MVLRTVVAGPLLPSILLFLFTLFPATFLLAQTVTEGVTPVPASAPLSRGSGDYFAEVAVNGQDPAEQGSAQRVAMRMILLRTSTDKTLLNKEGIRRALVSAENFILESAYRIPGDEDRITRNTPITPKVRQSGEATHLLSMRFDAAAISALVLGQAEQEETDPDAPPTPVPTTALAWLLIDDGSGEYRIGGTTGRNVIERSREIAGGVGQAIVFPQQDEPDQLALTADDIRAGNQQRITAASGRYQQPVVLTGILKRSRARGWTAEWSRYYNAEVIDQSFEAGSLDQALQQGINWLATLRNQPLAGTADQPAGLQTGPAYQPIGARGIGAADEGLVWMGRVATTEAYAAVLQLIEEVESVQLVYPKQVLAAGMLFSVSPRYAVNDVALRLSQVNWITPAAALSSTLEDAGSVRPQAADAYYEYLR